MTGYATAGMPFGYDPMAEAYEQAIKAGVNPLDPMNKKPKPKQQEVLPKVLLLLKTQVFIKLQMVNLH